MANDLDRLLAGTRRQAEARDTTAWRARLDALVNQCHPRQRDFVLDPSRRIAALVARGSGKTTGGRVRFIRRMMTTARARCAYVATTRQQAADLVWLPLKDLLEKLGIDARFNETQLTCTLTRNDSRLRLVGADDLREIDKLRGQPFHEFGIDEAGSFPAKVLEHLIQRVVGPRLGDYGGVLWMVGTPGHVQAGPFWDATRPGSEISRPWADRENPRYADWLRWSTHSWTLQDNAAMPQLWQEALREKEANGWGDDHPVWRREYLGQWALDDTENVFKYRAFAETGERWNSWEPGTRDLHRVIKALPAGHEWRFVYGIDLGHHDPFALEVFAFCDTDPHLWHVYEFHQRGVTVREIAELLQGPERDGGLFAVTGWPERIVADTAGLGDMVLGELAEVYGISVEPAEKKNKHDAIELWNGDLQDGLIKILPGTQLETEQSTLQWARDPLSGLLREDKGQLNNCSDAAIYARRGAGHRHAHEPAPPPPLAGSREAVEAQALADELRESGQTGSEWDGLLGPDSFDPSFFR